MAARRRLDTELVRRGLADSRTGARGLVDTGRVLVNGAVAGKVARLVDPGDSLEVTGARPRFVGRGGEKLAAALEAFPLVIGGRRCIDAGASTGGFTDCLLQAGAATVVAVDVGYGQLHERIESDPRVLNLERTNIRHVGTGDVGGPAPVLVADLSFISLTLVIPTLVGLVEPAGNLILLVKPQFEAGKAEADRGRGVIRDPAVWTRVLEEVAAAALHAGAPVEGGIVSPIRGGDGNVEFLLHLRRGADPDATPFDAATLVASVPGLPKT